MDEDFDYDGGETHENESGQANAIAYIAMFIGWLFILVSVADYVRARRMEKIMTAEPTDTIV